MNPSQPKAHIVTVQELSNFLATSIPGNHLAVNVEAAIRRCLQGATGLDLGAMKPLPVSGLTPEEVLMQKQNELEKALLDQNPNSFEEALKHATGEESPDFTALNCQVGGSHYKDHKIQHVEFCQLNQLTWCESSAMKYLMRHRKKNKVQDVDKAIHYCLLLREIEYPDAPEIDLPVGKKA